MLDAHKVLHAYLYGTRLLLCFPKHFERMCAVCVNTGSNIDCRRKRVAALSVPFENIMSLSRFGRFGEVQLFSTCTQAKMFCYFGSRSEAD